MPNDGSGKANSNWNDDQSKSQIVQKDDTTRTLQDENYIVYNSNFHRYAESIGGELIEEDNTEGKEHPNTKNKNQALLR